MKKFLPIILILIAGGAGGAGGVFFKKSSTPTSVDHASGDTHTDDSENNKKHGKKKKDKGHGDKDEKKDVRVFTFGRQFIVPVIKNNRPHSLIILDINIEIDDTIKDTAYSREPILRDAFLSVLLGLADKGVLIKATTDAEALAQIKSALLKPSKNILGDGATNVLILDIGVQPYASNASQF